MGKNPVEVISISNTPENQQILQKYEGQNIWKIIDRMEIKFTKAHLKERSIAIIPSNNFCFIRCPETPNLGDELFEVISWNLLPKSIKSITSCYRALEDKNNLCPGMYSLPLSLILTDYLSHEYLGMKTEIAQFLVTYL